MSIIIPKILLVVLGSKGMLGHTICKYFKMISDPNIKLIEICRNDFDALADPITKISDIVMENIIYDKMDVVIINAIGMIPQAGNKYSITNDNYQKINKDFPHKVADVCELYRWKLIHPTTDCVYTGSKGLYVETDPHDEGSIYGRSKSEGEPLKHTVIRSSIIGEEISNNRSLLEWVKSNKGGEIMGFCNHYWNGITCLQYSKIIHTIISENLFWEGVRHILSPRTVSKYELVEMINNVYDLKIKINPHNTATTIDKSLNTIYDTNSIFKIPDLLDQINEMKNF